MLHEKAVQEVPAEKAKQAAQTQRINSLHVRVVCLPERYPIVPKKTETIVRWMMNCRIYLYFTLGRESLYIVAVGALMVAEGLIGYLYLF